MAAWIKTPLGMELGLSSGDFVLDGDPAAAPPSKFSAHIGVPCFSAVMQLHQVN